MQMFDVYNDNGFYLRAPLKAITEVFMVTPIGRKWINEQLGLGKNEIEMRMQDGKVYTIFKATNSLPASAPNIFEGSPKKGAA
jgi:hypothetical protein